MSAKEEFKSWMDSVIAMHRDHVTASVHKWWKYCCVEDFVMSNGKQYPIRPRPKGVRQMAVKCCFRNAYLTSQRNGWDYCEGYGVTGFFPILHAWCVDDEGYVVDTTWRDGTYYFGVIFPTYYIDQVAVSKGTWGVIDNWKGRFPLVSGEHNYNSLLNEYV